MPSASKDILSLLVNKIVCYKRESIKNINLDPKTSFFCIGAPLCGWKNIVIWDFYILISVSLRLRILFLKCFVPKYFHNVFPFPTSDRLHSNFSLWSKLRSSLLGKDVQVFMAFFACRNLTLNKVLIISNYQSCLKINFIF